MIKLENATIYNGDCLDVLPQIDGGIKAVVTDPPYMINTKSDGSGKINPWGDYINGAYWYSAWIRQARKKLSVDGCLWSCLNWRSMVTFQKAAADIGWPIESLLIWDKCWIGPGGNKGLRPSYEMVALFANDDFKISDRSAPDIQRFKWSAIKPHGHPAEKPVELMQWIIEKSTDKGDVILDPFMGSGTTGVAAIRCGRRFIGIEQDPKWFSVAEERLRTEINQTSLFD